MRKHLPQGHPKIAVAYLRTSTDEQHLSPDAQRAWIQAWAVREHTRVAGWYEDRGVCSVAPVTDRPALGAALAALSTQCAGVLVVARRDRLARDVVLAAELERAVARVGARVVSATGEGNGDSPAERVGSRRPVRASSGADGRLSVTSPPVRYKPRTGLV